MTLTAHEKRALWLAFALCTFGCTDPMTAPQINEVTRQCEAQGMDVREVRSAFTGKVQRVECAP